MNSYSQHGEDNYIARYIAAHELWVPKLIVEAGALDGKKNSNSLAFIERGWSAILIEPNPHSFEKLERLHQDNEKVDTVQMAIVDTVNSCLIDFYTDQARPGHSRVADKPTAAKVLGHNLSGIVRNSSQYTAKNIGILSLDLEGGEDAALMDIQALQPCFVIIEANTPQAKQQQTAALENYYTPIAFMSVNTIWLRNDLT